MDDVIQRLRASKERIGQANHEAGKTAGARWAKQIAEYDELERLSRHLEERVVEDAEGFESVVDPDGERDPRDWIDFWEQNGCREPSDEYVMGFVDAAVVVFEEVVDKL